MTPWNLALKLMQLPPPVSISTRELILRTLAKSDNTVHGLRQAIFLTKGEVIYELGQLVKEGWVESRRELRGKNVTVVWSLIKEREAE